MDNRIEIPFLDLRTQYTSIQSEIREALSRVFETQLFILGPEVESLEHKVADYSHCNYGIGVSSGTDALLVALMAIDIKPGEEVITSAYSFFSTAGSIARLGARPVFVDIDPISYNINPEKIEQAINTKTRAIIPVHLFGLMTEMDPIMDLARFHNLYIIEDAAQAIGAEYGGKRAGSVGHLGCLSFFPSKNLGGFGDGGMVVTNDEILAKRVKILRNHGASPKYHHKVIGGNFRLDTIQAAVLQVKLKYLDDWITKRQHNAFLYNGLFKTNGLEGRYIQLPYKGNKRRHTYNQYVIRVNHRDELKRFMRSHGIGCEVYYPSPLHLQECFNHLGFKPDDLPVSLKVSQEAIALPIYPELTEIMQNTVVNTIADFYNGFQRFK